MQRRELLRRSTAALSVAAGIGIAGCSGGGDGGSGADGGDGGDGGSGSGSDGNDGGDGGSGDGGDGGGDGEDGGGDYTAAGTVDVSLSDDGLYTLGEYTSSVDGIQVVELSSDVQTFDESAVMTVDLEVRNAGAQPTEIDAYTYTTTLYDESASELKTTNPATGTSGAREDVDPGSSANVTLSVQLREIAPEDVASYDLDVNCSGSFADGAYC